MTRRLSWRLERWPLARPFVTAGTVDTDVEVLVVAIAEGDAVGRGEAAGVHYLGETGPGMADQVDAVRAAIEAGAGREGLQALLPPGGARNAVDCALWELEARLRSIPVTALADVAATTLRTVTTVGLGTPADMAAEAARLSAFALLKVKLGAEDPVARVAAVREARPDARLIVDANGAWAPAQLHAAAGPLAALGVEMIEQPCPPEHDGELDGAALPVPLCADESCRTRADLPRLGRGYALINIKLDKTGGLTEALALARTARAAGFGLVVGNMLGTCLAMAPASLIGPLCRYVDLDGPVLLALDRPPGLGLRGDTVPPLVPAVWGG